MAAPDSWEDMDDTPPPPPPSRYVPPNSSSNNNSHVPPNFRLNVNAPTFAFNPGAVTFTPNYGAPPPPGYGGYPQGYGGYPQGYGGYPQSYGGYAPGYAPQQQAPQQRPQQVQGYNNNQRGRGQGSQPAQYDNQQHYRSDGQHRSNGYRPPSRPVMAEGNGVRPQQQQYRGPMPAAQVSVPVRDSAREGQKEPVSAKAKLPAPVKVTERDGQSVVSNEKEMGSEVNTSVATPVLSSPSPAEKPQPPVVAPTVQPSSPAPTIPAPSAKVDDEVVSQEVVSEEVASNVVSEQKEEEAPATEEPQVAVQALAPVSDVADVTDKMTALDIKAPEENASPVVKEVEEHGEQSEPQVDDPVAEEDDIVDEDEDPRDHLNLVFIGHVDAGKSTIGGQILYLSDMVDKRTIEKFEREAKDKNRESWYMAYIMDTNEEERAKGKTVEVGRAHFETEKRRYTVLDAPGHKNYVPNMISGASQADVGVLVIAARKGEFETGFERGGQTREHAQLAKTLGVSKLVVVVNKMDDPSVNWDKERFDEIVTKMTPFLKACGYNTKKDVQFLPISGLMGINMKDRMGKDVCPWWDGPAFFETLDALTLPERDPKGPFRMPLIDKYRDMGTVVMGKIESGSVRRGDNLVIMPNKAQVKVVSILRDNDEVKYAKPGENLRVRISGIEEEDILPGFVLSSIKRPIVAVMEFDAQLQILELLDHKAIFTAGYKAILHIHSVVEECEIIDLLQQMDPKTRKMMKKKPLFVKSNAIVTARIQVTQQICVELFAAFPQLGRFTLRDEGKTVAIGKVISLLSQGTD